MSKQTKPKKAKTAVTYPLYGVNRNDGNGRCLWIIAKTAAEAMAKAETIWHKAGVSAVPKEITIEHRGTVDYIPKMKTPHWEL